MNEEMNMHVGFSDCAVHFMSQKSLDWLKRLVNNPKIPITIYQFRASLSRKMQHHVKSTNAVLLKEAKINVLSSKQIILLLLLFLVVMKVKDVDLLSDLIQMNLLIEIL